MVVRLQHKNMIAELLSGKFTVTSFWVFSWLDLWRNPSVSTVFDASSKLHYLQICCEWTEGWPRCPDFVLLKRRLYSSPLIKLWFDILLPSNELSFGWLRPLFDPSPACTGIAAVVANHYLHCQVHGWAVSQMPFFTFVLHKCLMEIWP